MSHQASAVPESPLAPAAGKQVLICDDNDILVDILEHVLMKAGYRVNVAYNGVDCLEKFAEQKPDIMIIDLDMPGLGGFGVIEKLEKSRELAGTTLLIISGREHRKDVSRAQGLGAADFLVKPFNVENLLKHVESAPIN